MLRIPNFSSSYFFFVPLFLRSFFALLFFTCFLPFILGDRCGFYSKLLYVYIINFKYKFNACFSLSIFFIISSIYHITFSLKMSVRFMDVHKPFSFFVLFFFLMYALAVIRDQSFEVQISIEILTSFNKCFLICNN